MADACTQVSAVGIAISKPDISFSYGASKSFCGVGKLYGKVTTGGVIIKPGLWVVFGIDGLGKGV